MLIGEILRRSVVPESVNEHLIKGVVAERVPVPLQLIANSEEVLQKYIAVKRLESQPDAAMFASKQAIYQAGLERSVNSIEVTKPSAQTIEGLGVVATEDNTLDLNESDVNSNAWDQALEELNGQTQLIQEARENVVASHTNRKSQQPVQAPSKKVISTEPPVTPVVAEASRAAQAAAVPTNDISFQIPEVA